MPEGLSQFLTFIKNIFLSICDFISSNKFILYAFLIPIVFAVLAIVFDFLFDLGHVLDGYNAKKSFAFKGYSRYEKQQAQLRKQEEIEQKKAEKQAIKMQKEIEKAANPYKHTVTRWQDKDGKWHSKEVYTRRDNIQPDVPERDPDTWGNAHLYTYLQHKPKISSKQGRALEQYYFEAPKEKKPKKNIDIYVED